MIKVKYIDAPSSYNMIIRQPTLNQLRDQEIAKKSYVKSMELENKMAVTHTQGVNYVDVKLGINPQKVTPKDEDLSSICHESTKVT